MELSKYWDREVCAQLERKKKWRSLWLVKLRLTKNRSSSVICRVSSSYMLSQHTTISACSRHYKPHTDATLSAVFFFFFFPSLLFESWYETWNNCFLAPTLTQLFSSAPARSAHRTPFLRFLQLNWRNLGCLYLWFTSNDREWIFYRFFFSSKRLRLDIVKIRTSPWRSRYAGVQPPCQDGLQTWMMAAVQIRRPVTCWASNITSTAPATHQIL